MLILRTVLPLTLLSLLSTLTALTIPAALTAQTQQLTLSVTGDKHTGFLVAIADHGKPLVANTEEFSIRLFNTDYSTTANISSWKGASWSGTPADITLSRDTYIPELDANLSVSVRYQLINAQVIRKTIRLFQPSMPDMYYILEETTRPAQKPIRFTTFENDSFPGGPVHEMYPAAGWLTPDGSVVGLLTDAGFKNQYTRTTRRRFSGRGGGFVGMRQLPDPALYAIAAPENQQASSNGSITQRFGEYYDLDAGTTRSYPMTKPWTKTRNTDYSFKENQFDINCHPGGDAGLKWIAPLKDQQVYTISFYCKGNSPLALKLFRLRNGQQTVELEDGAKYIDNFPVHPNEWTQFKGSILVPYIDHDSVTLFIGTQSGKEARLQIRDLRILQHQPASLPYNHLPIGQSAEKTTFLFIEPWTSHKDFMISAQTRLAEGKGFQGSPIEKMLYANFNALTWITSIRDTTPFNVPNMNYAPDMYNRDSYFSTVATYNKELNLSLWEQWGRTQTPQGGIGTIITPYMGSVEVKDNEATIEWLIWAMLNKRRFGYDPPKEKITRAVNFVLRTFDSAHDGKCRSHFPMSQVDIIDYNPATDRLAVNQGMLAIALRTIRELGYPIEESYIALAEEEYRKFYDPVRKHLLFDRQWPDIISLTDLEPEFFSLWLFNRPILTDEMVTSHLDLIPILNKVPNSPHPEYGTTAPICVRITRDKQGYAYLSRDYQPFEKFGAENYADGKSDGFYYNGGSWMRAEYCAYVVGLKHGWEKALPLMENRAWAEINLNPKWPFSKEFIPTKWTTTDSWWPSTRGLCWNVFILMADELAGLRSPAMDPDYRKP